MPQLLLHTPSQEPVMRRWIAPQSVPLMHPLMVHGGIESQFGHGWNMLPMCPLKGTCFLCALERLAICPLGHASALHSPVEWLAIPALKGMILTLKFCMHAILKLDHL